MQLTALFGVLLATGVAFAQLTDPSITSPSLTECTPASFTVAGSAPPFLVAVYDAADTGNVNAQARAFLPTVNAPGAFTWNVNLPATSNITVRVTDSRGMIGSSAPLVIAQGQSTACVSSSASFSQQAGATGTSASITGVTSALSTSRPASTNIPSSQTPVTTPIGTISSEAGGSGGSNGATTTSRSGASSTYVAGSAMGLIGAAVLALMA